MQRIGPIRAYLERQGCCYQTEAAEMKYWKRDERLTVRAQIQIKVDDFRRNFGMEKAWMMASSGQWERVGAPTVSDDESLTICRAWSGLASSIFVVDVGCRGRSDWY